MRSATATVPVTPQSNPAIEPPLLSKTLQAVADISAADVVAKATGAIFGKPLVLNVWRAMLVESLLDLVLPTEWTWCSTDYASYDFRHTDGTRLEVKQSAALQSWTKIGGQPSKASFDIGTRTGAWDGPTWNLSEKPIRNADLYVMAHHPVVDETADHRNPHHKHASRHAFDCVEQAAGYRLSSWLCPPGAEN